MDLSNRMHFRKPWNKGKLVGQKAPLKVKDIWAIRVRLQMHGLTRDLALFDLGIDSQASQLRSCEAARPGCVPRWPSKLTGNCASAEDTTSDPI